MAAMHSLRRVFVAVALLFSALAARADAVAPGPLGVLQTELSTMSMHAPGNVGIMVEDLTTGLSTSVNANAQMPAASTIKIPVMVEVFKRLEHGDFDLNRKVTLQASDRDWGSGDLCDARVGSKYTVSRLLTLMITDSDNTATNMLIRLVAPQCDQRRDGRPRPHARPACTITSARKARSATRCARAPNDMVKLMTAMARYQLVDEWSSREMIAIMAGQHHNGLIPVPLPKGTTIAHKTGELHDTLNDVGVVYLNSEPYAIAVMATNLSTLDAGYSLHPRRLAHRLSRTRALQRLAPGQRLHGDAVRRALPAAGGNDVQPRKQQPRARPANVDAAEPAGERPARQPARSARR